MQEVLSDMLIREIYIVSIYFFSFFLIIFLIDSVSFFIGFQEYSVVPDRWGEKMKEQHYPSKVIYFIHLYHERSSFPDWFRWWVHQPLSLAEIYTTLSLFLFSCFSFCFNSNIGSVGLTYSTVHTMQTSTVPLPPHHYGSQATCPPSAVIEFCLDGLKQQRSLYCPWRQLQLCTLSSSSTMLFIFILLSPYPPLYPFAPSSMLILHKATLPPYW